MINQYNIILWYLQSFRCHHPVCLSWKWGVGSSKNAERPKVDGVWVALPEVGKCHFSVVSIC